MLLLRGAVEVDAWQSVLRGVAFYSSSHDPSGSPEPSQRVVSSDSMPQSAQHMLRRSTQRGSGAGTAAGDGDVEMDELGDDGSTALISFGGLGRKVRLVHGL